MFTKKGQSCQNNPEKSYTEKKTKHEPSGWAMFTKYSFDENKNENSLLRKEMIPLTDKENESSEEQSFVRMKMMKITKTEKRLKTSAITPENLEELLIAFAI